MPTLHLRGMIKIPFDVALPVSDKRSAEFAYYSFVGGGWEDLLAKLLADASEDVVVYDQQYEED